MKNHIFLYAKLNIKRYLFFYNLFREGIQNIFAIYHNLKNTITLLFHFYNSQ